MKASRVWWVAQAAQRSFVIQTVTCSVQIPKLRRFVMFCSDGDATATATSSRRYCHEMEMPRFGFAFCQCGPSVRQSSHVGQLSDGCVLPAVRHLSHASSAAMNANQASFVFAPSRIS